MFGNKKNGLCALMWRSRPPNVGSVCSNASLQPIHQTSTPADLYHVSASKLGGGNIGQNALYMNPLLQLQSKLCDQCWWLAMRATPSPATRIYQLRRVAQALVSSAKLL